MDKTTLHIAVIDDFNECLVSYSQEELKIQITRWLTDQAIAVPTVAEWADIFGEDRYDIDLTTPASGWISYYQIKSKLDSSGTL